MIIQFLKKNIPSLDEEENDHMEDERLGQIEETLFNLTVIRNQALETMDKMTQMDVSEHKQSWKRVSILK